MNSVNIIGRLTDDPEIRRSQDGKAFAIFNLAYNKPNRDAVFFACKSFGKTAEFMEKYIHKGSKVAISGYLDQDTWQKDGKKFQRVVIVANQLEFAEGKGEKSEAKPKTDEFMQIPEGSDEELPFN